jgi:hypothetical protein
MLVDSHGQLGYQGVFLPYDGKIPMTERDIMIDPEGTNKNWFERSVWVGEELVPVVQLRNGNVLIPEKAYAAGKKRLDELRAAQKP